MNKKMYGELIVDQIWGSSHWRTNHQLGGICSEVDGQSFLASDFAGLVHRYDTKDGKRLNTLQLGLGQINCIAANSEFAVCGGVRNLAIINLRDFSVEHVIYVEEAIVEIALDSKGQFMFVDYDGEILWGTVDSIEVSSIEIEDKMSAPVLRWHPHDDVFLAVCNESIFRLSLAGDRGEVSVVARMDAPVRSLAAFGPGKLLGMTSRYIYEVDMHTFDGWRVLEAPADTSFEKLVSNPWNNLVAIAESNSVTIYDTGDGKVVARSADFAWIGACCFVDKHKLAFGAPPQQIVCLRTDNSLSQRESNLESPGWIHSCVFSQPGWIATIARGGYGLTFIDRSTSNKLRWPLPDARVATLGGALPNGDVILAVLRQGTGSVFRVGTDLTGHIVIQQAFAKTFGLAATSHRICLIADQEVFLTSINGDLLHKGKLSHEQFANLSFGSNEICVAAQRFGVSLITFHHGKMHQEDIELTGMYIGHCESFKSRDAHIAIDIEHGTLLLIENGTAEAILHNDLLQGTQCIKLDPSEKLVAIGTFRGLIMLLDIGSRKIVARAQLESAIHSIAIENGEVLAGLGDCTAVVLRSSH